MERVENDKITSELGPKLHSYIRDNLFTVVT